MATEIFNYRMGDIDKKNSSQFIHSAYMPCVCAYLLSGVSVALWIKRGTHTHTLTKKQNHDNVDGIWIHLFAAFRVLFFAYQHFFSVPLMLPPFKLRWNDRKNWRRSINCSIVNRKSFFLLLSNRTMANKFNGKCFSAMSLHLILISRDFVYLVDSGAIPNSILYINKEGRRRNRLTKLHSK